MSVTGACLYGGFLNAATARASAPELNRKILRNANQSVGHKLKVALHHVMLCSGLVLLLHFRESIPGKCVSRVEYSHLQSAYGHIQNHALKFCSGLFGEVLKMAARNNQLSESLTPHRSFAKLSKRDLRFEIYSTLGHQEAQKICQTALDGQVSPEAADEELLHPELPVQDPPPAENTRLYKVLDGKVQTGDSWKQLLTDVCKDECDDLLKQMGRNADDLLSSSSPRRPSISEACAERVVQKVEAEVLTCCAEECGWDEQQCQLWPFMDASQQSSC